MCWWVKLSNMRKLIVGITIGFLAASTLAWAVTVRFPSVLKVKGIVFVDEAGNVLGGATPTTVDVVNMPTSLDVNITNLPSTGSESSGELFTTTLGSNTEFIVPAGKELRITDILRNSSNVTCYLSKQAADNEIVNTLAFYGAGSGGYQFGTPFVFSEGERLKGEGNCYVLGLLVPTS
jgi:hypothetical protein